MIIGGYCDGVRTSIVAKYENEKWTLVGNCAPSWDQRNPWRISHRAISNGDRFYVVGGQGKYPTEIWTFEDKGGKGVFGNLNRKIDNPILGNYAYYPELFVVDSDY